MAQTRALLLAGGRGTRLAPYTSVLPKPLMPIGEKSVLEVVVGQLADAGVRRITLCVGYLSHLIRAIFEDGAEYGVTIDYVHEPEPLGTAGPLRLVQGLESTFLVMNGDILTTLDYAELLRYHRTSGNRLTIAAHDRTVKVDYGVIEVDGDDRVAGYEEKPEMPAVVSMGIYVCEPSILLHVPIGRRFEFPQLVDALLEAGEPVGVYRYDGLWFDIGRQEDYEAAATAWLNGHDVPAQKLPDVAR
jgi:NDP-sugar pyrophosphorylase family protein